MFEMTLISLLPFKLNVIYLSYNMANAGKKKKIQWRLQFFSVIVLDPVCFDGLELSLVYKLQYKEAAPDGNGVYFCSK